MTTVDLFRIVAFCGINVGLDTQVPHHDERPAPYGRDGDEH
jgi:hypothetical protein